jgi:hypothetical protein
VCEFGEMVITSAFQADFVGSSPIIRKYKVFRGGIKHVKKMAFDTAISQNDETRGEGRPSNP